METKKRYPQAKPGMTSTELREVIKQLVNAELKDVQPLLDQCSLEKRAALLIRIGNTVLPRETAKDVKDEWINTGRNVDVMRLGDNEEDILVYPREKKPKKAGRPLGAPNKKSQKIRERLEAVFISEYNYITGRLGELAPDKRIDLLLKLSLFTIPSQSAKELSNEGNEKDEHVTMLLD